MAIKTLYTAVGRFERRTNGCNRSCPIILLGGQEYMADMQEMVIWSMLNWRILRWDDIAQEYEKLATASGYCTERSWEDCTNRLLTRGLLVSGSGETEYDALYDLLGSLSIIPTSGPFFLRLASFVKLTLLAHVPVSAARKLFQKDKRTKYEVLVMRLAGQLPVGGSAPPKDWAAAAVPSVGRRIWLIRYGTIKALRVYQRNVPYLSNTFRPAVIQYLQLRPFPKCPAQLIQVFDHALFSFPRPTGQSCCAVCSPFLPAAYLPKFNSWTIRRMASSSSHAA